MKTIGRHERGERGAMSLELVVLFPAVMLIIFGTIQGALYFHARNVALSSAQEGLREARAENGSTDQGRSAARDFIDDAGGSDVMTNVQVTASSDGDDVTVTVTGRPLTVIPGVLNFTVTQSATGPIEQFTGPGG